MSKLTELMPCGHYDVNAVTLKNVKDGTTTTNCEICMRDKASTALEARDKRLREDIQGAIKNYGSIAITHPHLSGWVDALYAALVKED